MSYDIVLDVKTHVWDGISRSLWNNIAFASACICQTWQPSPTKTHLCQYCCSGGGGGSWPEIVGCTIQLNAMNQQQNTSAHSFSSLGSEVAY